MQNKKHMTVDHEDVSLTSGDFQDGFDDDAMVVVNCVKIALNAEENSEIDDIVQISYYTIVFVADPV